MLVAGFAIGYAVGAILAWLVRLGLDRVDEAMARSTGPEVVVAAGGVLLGLGVAALVSVAVVRIPYVGVYLLVPLFLLSGYFTAYLAAKKHVEILRLVGVRGAFEADSGMTPAKIVDSSAIIDGRIIDVVKTGFVEGEILVPRFVVEELQRLADSSDAEKRVRGRRGLDFVRRLQNQSGQVRIEDTDYADIDAVDAKLVRLGGELGAHDPHHRLHPEQGGRDPGRQGAQRQRPRQLGQVGRPSRRGHRGQDPPRRARARPGRRLPRRRHHDRRRGGRALVGSRVSTEVTSVLQSPSGKMIFGRLVR